MSGAKEEFDVVILTLPAPQVLQLVGDVPSLLSSQPELRDGFRAVTFSSRYAMALYFNSGDGQHEPWAAKYIDDHPIFRYIAIDNRKRNRPERPPAAVLHTNIKYGAENVEKTLIEMEPVLLEEYNKLFQGWPKPAAVKCQKWRYSQVIEGPQYFLIYYVHDLSHLCRGDYPITNVSHSQVTSPFPGKLGCATLLKEPLLISGGDSFTGSGFDNCLTSAKSLAQEVLDFLGLT